MLQRGGEISVSLDTLNGANLHIMDAKIFPHGRRRRMKGANSIASPVTYTPLYRATAAALKLTAAPPTTMLTPLLTLPAAFCMGIIK